MKRLIAMVAASALLVGAIAFADTRYGTRRDGLYYQVSDIRPDAQLMRVNGEPVYAEEYFYWLASVCDYLSSYSNGQLDFNAQVTDDMTYGQYAKFDAAETVKLYAVVRQMVAAEGITLRDEDRKALETQRAQYVAYYGSEEAYQHQLRLLGISEEMLQSIESTPYLYSQLMEMHCAENGSLRPSDEELRTFGEEHGYVTAQLLFFPTTGLEDTAVAEVRAKAENYRQRWLEAQDKSAAYLSMCTQLQLQPDEEGLTFEASTSDAAVCQAVSALSVGQISDVIQGEVGFYVALRLDLQTNALTENLFNIYLQEAQDSAKVDYSKRMYDSIDAGLFYNKLAASRTLLAQAYALQQQMGLGQ